VIIVLFLTLTMRQEQIKEVVKIPDSAVETAAAVNDTFDALGGVQDEELDRVSELLLYADTAREALKNMFDALERTYPGVLHRMIMDARARREDISGLITPPSSYDLEEGVEAPDFDFFGIPPATHDDLVRAGIRDEQDADAGGEVGDEDVLE
jgi:hypothetical protein